jgi:hypothetical protein
MKLLLAVILFASTAVAQGATLDSEEAASKLVDHVMAKIGSGDVEGGFFLMKPFFLFPEAELDLMLGQVKLQLVSIQGRIGKSIGSEFIHEKTLGKSLFHTIYLQKFEKGAIRWRFLFYGVNGKWSVSTVAFDDKVHLLFGE